MRVKFIHEAIDGVCHVFGEAFAAGKWVKVDHLADDHKAALAANPTFVTDTAEAAPAPVAKPTLVIQH